MQTLIAISAETGARRAQASDDLALLRRVADGDRRAFEQLYVAYHRRLCRFLMRIAGQYGLVEEIVNDTLLVVWQKAGEFRAEAQVSTWIMGIAYRRALKTLEHLHIAQRSEQTSVENETWQSADHAPQLEQSEWLRLGLAALPLEQRMTLELAYFMGHSCEEISAITQCPVNTVKTRMFHARAQLREHLPQLAGAPTGESA